MADFTIRTDLAGLVLTRMLSIGDDREYFAFQMRNRAHIAEFGNTIDPDLGAVTKRRVAKGRVRFGVRKDGELVGVVDYVPSEDGKEAEVGILLSQNEGGHGYATATLKTMTAYLESRYERIFAEVDPRNEKSMRLCERVGFVLKPGFIRREWGDAVVLEYKS